ncbi:hypothetical protein GC207_02810 [bacterium]|nr:hypothetical protein [bacterium]
MVAIIGITVFLFFAGKPEPTHEENPLSYFVALYEPYQGNSDADRQYAGQAIKEMGTNAVPFLLKWIRYEEPDRVDQIRDWLWARTKEPFFNRQNDEDRARAAVYAFRALGPAADESIGALAEVANNSKRTVVATRAIEALGYCQRTNALNRLVTVLTNSSSELRDVAAHAFCNMGELAAPALPDLIRSIGDAELSVASNAIASLGELRLKPDLVVPALAAALDDPRGLVRIAAEVALQKYGAAAKAAIPALLRALSDPQIDVRQYATNAVEAIDPNVLPRLLRE